MREFSKRYGLKMGGFVIVMIVVAKSLFNNIDEVPLHMDEHAWVRRAAIFYEAYFVDRDFTSKRWSSYEAYDQFMLAKYIYGAWMKVWLKDDLNKYMQVVNFNQGWSEEDGYFELWTSDKWWIKYSSLSNIYDSLPYDYWQAYQLIVLNRYVSVIFGLGVLLLVFLIGKEISDYWVGWLGMLYLSLNNLFRILTQQAMLESIPLFFFLFAVWVYLKNHKMLDKWRARLLVGISVGMAIAVKINGAMFMCAFLISEAYKFAGNHRTINARNWRKVIGRFMCSQLSWVVLAVLIVLIFNPVLWEDPVNSFERIYQQRQNTFKYQIESYHLYYLPTVWTRLLSICSQTIWYRAHILNTGYNILIWHGFRFLMFVFGIMGLVGGLGNRAKLHKNIKIFVTIALVVFGFMSVYLVIGFERYYLPIVPFVLLITALGTKWFILLMRCMLKKKMNKQKIRKTLLSIGLALGLLGISEIMYIIRQQPAVIVNFASNYYWRKILEKNDIDDITVMRYLDKMYYFRAYLSKKSYPQLMKYEISKLELSRINSLPGLKELIGQVDDSVIDINKNGFARLLYNIGLLAFNYGDNDLGEALWRRSIVMAPQWSYFYTELANYYMVVKDRSACEEVIGLCQQFKYPKQACAEYEHGVMQEQPVGFLQESIDREVVN